MLPVTSGTYVLIGLAAAAASYVMAHRKGRNAVAWSWASLFLIVPALILPFVGSRRASARASTLADESWHALLAYDPEMRAAAAQLAPFGAPALDDLRRSWSALPDKAALPAMVADIAACWAAHASAGLTYVETRDGVAVLRDAAARYHVEGRQTADLATARLMASAAARRTGRSALIGALILGATVLASLALATGPARAQADAVAMTLPSCETYQSERPRGGAPEQFSDLFGLSIYRWDEADYGRVQSFLIDCKRSRPDFRPDQTLRDWEDGVRKTLAGLQTYTGYVNQLGEPMAARRGARPRRGEPDPTFAFEALSCDRLSRSSVNAWARGGPPDNTPDAPFSVPLALWRYEVWRAFENRVLACVQVPGGETQTERDWLHTLVYGQEVNNAAAIAQARQDVAAGATKLTGILARAAEAERVSSADELAGKLKAVEALSASGPRLGRGDEERVAAARERITVRLRAARAAEAEAWERDRPAREARARAQEAELAELQRRNREREAEAAGERERTARIEAERQTGIRAQAERQAAEAAAQVQRDVDARTAERQAREKADAETDARLQREYRARLATDPCNQAGMRRQLMDAANAMDRARYGGRRLLDLTDGSTIPEQEASTRSCRFVADWSSGQRGLVTITVRKNSFGDDLIEVRP